MRRLVAVLLVGMVVLALGAPAAALAPTGVPELLSPASGEAVKGNPVLRWAAVPGAVKYKVSVSASSSFTPTVYSVDPYALSATPTSDLPLGTIYWRVAATDGTSTGVGPYSVGQFTREATTQPELLAPADQSELAYPAVAPVLAWSPVPGVKTYRVELDDAADFIGATITNTSNTSLALSAPLTLGKTYHWRVQGVSATAGVTTEYSSTWRFSTHWPAPDGRPVLTSPIGGAAVDVTEVVFQWSPVAGARTYQLQVNSNPDFANNMTEDVEVTGTQYSPPQTYNNATYFWRVRALDTGSPAHQGPWSEVGTFLRSWLDQPELVSPASGAVTTTQRFEWTAVPRASHYQLDVATDENFSTYVTCTTFQTSLTATIAERVNPAQRTDPPKDPSKAACGLELQPGGHYFWRVRGRDMPPGAGPGVNGVWSETSDFHYEPTGTVTLSSPANGASVSAPVLTWQPLAAFSRYRVSVVKTSTGSSVANIDTYATSYTPTSQLTAGADYTWYVVGLTAGGELGVAPSTANRWHFTATAPSGGGTLEPLATTSASTRTMPSMSWQPVSGAAYYRVFTLPQGASTATQLSGTTKLYQTAYTHPTDVLGVGSHEWYVEAYDSGNVLLEESTRGTFTVDDVAFVSYVSPPNCVLPSCTATQRSTPELVWQAVPSAGFYRVWVALDKDFTNEVYVYTTEQTSLTPRESYLDNAAGQSYFWYVQPCISATRCGPFGGASRLAHEQAFRKTSAPAVLSSPVNGATVGDVVTLSWQDYRTSAPDGVGAEHYRVQVATDPAFEHVIDDEKVDQTTYQAWESAYPDGVYYWRVQAYDGADAPLTFSASRSFTKSSSAPVPTAALGEVTGLPTIRWGAQAYASGYAVEVYSGVSPLFPTGSRVLNATTKLPAYTPVNPLAAGLYSWRVRKLDPDGNPGPWSSGTPTFEVRQPSPELVAPANAAAIATDDLLFTWQPVAGAAAYRFESSTTSAFTTTLEKVTTVMTAWAPIVAYADGTTYHWRVRVLDGAGNVMADSVTRTVTKDSANPRVTAISPTSKLAPDGTITVTFSEPVTGVSASTLVVRPAGATTAVPGTLVVNGAVVTYAPTAPLVPGQPYDVVVLAGITDLLGNPATPSTSRTQVATAVDSTSPAIAERWDVDGSTKANGGAYISSRQAGATATFSFTGSAVSLTGRASVGGGYADVLVDGVKKATANFYSKTEVHKKVLYRTSALSAGAHTLTVKVLGTRQSGSTGTAVEVDALIAGATQQESAARTAFARYTTASAAGGSYDSTSQESDPSGAEYRFTFKGTGFSWQATKLPNGGTAAIYIDGAYKGTVSQYAKLTAYKVPVYSSPALADKAHSVRLVATGAVPTGSTGTNVSLDSITVR